ncbi:MAG: hypothetical protein J4G04_02770 [Nitrosopumilaceae archaeon]|nr:hypothetical protein [Nitrosopumilaceae archaeon]
MGMEQWIAAASMGLFVLFVGEMASIYHYMLQAPEHIEAGIIFEPDPKILQFISIGAAPGAIMAAVSFILSRRYGSRRVGLMIVVGGAALLVGMSYCYSITDSIHEVYGTTATGLAPPLFMLVSVPVMIFGVLLFRIRDRRPRKDYL